MNATLLWKQVADHLRELMAKFPDGLILGFVDANGAVGSVSSPCLGPCEPSRENPNRELFRLTLEEFGLLALNTFFMAGPTWSGSRGHKHRID